LNRKGTTDTNQSRKAESVRQRSQGQEDIEIICRKLRKCLKTQGTAIKG
jgi:hypothetical protein